MDTKRRALLLGNSILQISATLAMFGMALWVIAKFVTNAFRHPAAALLSYLPNDTIPGGNVFDSAPTFAHYGLFALFGWPLYYLTGIMFYLLFFIMAFQIAEYLARFEPSKKMAPIE